MERRFEYVIKVEGRDVWKGLNPTKKYFEIKRKNPKKEVAIAWRTKEKVLVCLWI
jgi:ribosomal protein L14E/L6E/L27E